MDIVKNEGVNVHNSVLVSGLSQTEVDEELERHLECYGSICRVLVIDDPKSEYHLCSIVEFTNSSAMQTLRRMLPMECQSSTDANIRFRDVPWVVFTLAQLAVAQPRDILKNCKPLPVSVGGHLKVCSRKN